MVLGFGFRASLLRCCLSWYGVPPSRLLGGGVSWWTVHRGGRGTNSGYEFAATFSYPCLNGGDHPTCGLLVFSDALAPKLQRLLRGSKRLRSCWLRGCCAKPLRVTGDIPDPGTRVSQCSTCGGYCETYVVFFGSRSLVSASLQASP